MEPRHRRLPWPALAEKNEELSLDRELLDDVLALGYALRDPSVPTTHRGRDAKRSGPATVDLEAHPSIRALESAGRYRVSSLLGIGGMGIVLRGFDRFLRRDVAIKIVRVPGMVDLEEFASEARIAANLQHPGILPVYDVGIVDGTEPYFTMKLVEGETLQSRIGQAGGSMEACDLLGVFHVVTEAVAFAHARGVLHQDLKPANVLLGAFGEVYVMDWGLARAFDEVDIEVPRSKRRAAGTPSYMAPEQARGVVPLTPAADVFSLGAILAEIMTGKTLHEGVPGDLKWSAAAEGRLQRARARVAGCTFSEELRDIALRCLESDPTKRPRDGRAVAELMASYLRGREKHARDAEMQLAQARVRASQSRKVRSLLVGLVLLVMVAAGTLLWTLETRNQRQLDDERRARQVVAALSEVGTGLEHLQAQPPADRVRIAAELAERATGALTWASSARMSRSVQEEARSLHARALAVRDRCVAAAQRQESDETAVRAIVEVRRALRSQHGRSLQSARPSNEWVERDRRYEEIYGPYRVAREEVPVGRVVERLCQSDVASELVEGLHDWIWVRSILHDGMATNDRIVSIAQASDPNTARRAAFADLLASDTQAMSHRIQECAPLLPPASLSLFCRELARRGDRAGSIDAFRAALAVHPSDANLRAGLGYVLSEGKKKEDLEDALLHLAAAAAIDPGHWVALHQAAVCATHLGRFAAAEALLQRALAIPDASDQPLLLNALGVALQKQKRFQDALLAFERARKRSPGDSLLAANLGTCLHQLGRSREALRVVEPHLHARRNAAIVHLAAQIYASLGEIEQALSRQREAVRLAPDFAPAWRGLAKLRMKDDRIEALEALRRAVSVAPHEPMHAAALAFALYRNGKGLATEKREAQGIMATAVRLRPASATYRGVYAEMLRHHGRFREALEQVEVGRSLAGQDGPPQGLLERLLARLESESELWDEIEAMLEGRSVVLEPSRFDQLLRLCADFDLVYTEARLWRLKFSSTTRPDPHDAERAATCASRATMGNGRHPVTLEPAAKEAWLSLALDWSLLAVEGVEESLRSGTCSPEVARASLSRWLEAPEYGPLRDRASSAKDASMRQRAVTLWKRVHAVKEQTLASGPKNAAVQFLGYGLLR